MNLTGRELAELMTLLPDQTAGIESIYDWIHRIACRLSDQEQHEFKFALLEEADTVALRMGRAIFRGTRYPIEEVGS